MNDQLREISTKSWGSRIISSIKGILLGFLMFIVSFGVLYWNEGRVDVSKIAKNAVEIEATSPAPTEASDELVSTTGILKSNEKIGDTFLEEGNYLSIERNVEMYAWQEEARSESKKNVGGSETTETTYTYKKDWTSTPMSSSNFKQPEGHQNPQMPLDRTSVRVKNVKIGMYDVDMNQVELPEHRALSLNNNNVILSNDFKLANDQHLFKGKGSISSPEVGDLKISYSVIHNPLDTATIFGKLDATSQKISPYYGQKNAKLYRIFEGTRDTAISTMKTEHTIMTWLLRAIGFALMWFGLMALFAPISVVLDVLPIFGSISKVGIGLITFIVSLVLSIITILVSMLIHNLIALIVVILLFIVGTIWYLKNKRKKQMATAKTV